jgi:hypothetical protein
MRESGSPEMRAPRETDCGRIGSAELLRSWRRPCRHRSSGLAMIELPGVIESGMPRGNGQRKPGTTRGSPRRSRTAKTLRISRYAVKSRCARGWGGWGRLSDDGSRQHNSSKSEDPWGGGLPHLHGGARSRVSPDTVREYWVASTCAKGRHKPNISRCMQGAGLSRQCAGRCCPKCQPSSRTGENPPCGMIGRVEETSASFEARSAPRSYPTEGLGVKFPGPTRQRCGNVGI